MCVPSFRCFLAARVLSVRCLRLSSDGALYVPDASPVVPSSVGPAEENTAAVRDWPVLLRWQIPVLPLRTVLSYGGIPTAYACRLRSQVSEFKGRDFGHGDIAGVVRIVQVTGADNNGRCKQNPAAARPLTLPV